MNALKRENFQRNAITKGLKEVNPDDLILISDVDEIPDLSNLNLESVNDEIILFKQNFYYYKFNLKLDDFIWYGSKACRFKDLLSPQWLREIKGKKFAWWRIDSYFSKRKYRNINFIKNGGWHYSYLKKPEDIQKKITKNIPIQ